MPTRLSAASNIIHRVWFVQEANGNGRAPSTHPSFTPLPVRALAMTGHGRLLTAGTLIDLDKHSRGEERSADALLRLRGSLRLPAGQTALWLAASSRKSFAHRENDVRLSMLPQAGILEAVSETFTARRIAYSQLVVACRGRLALSTPYRLARVFYKSSPSADLGRSG